MPKTLKYIAVIYSLTLFSFSVFAGNKTPNQLQRKPLSEDSGLGNFVCSARCGFKRQSGPPELRNTFSVKLTGLGKSKSETFRQLELKCQDIEDIQMKTEKGEVHGCPDGVQCTLSVYFG